MLKLAHLINPVNLPPPSDLVIAQPLVFEALRIARQAAADVASVELLAACYPEDVSIVPPWLRLTAPLERSILDLREFEVRRKLPLLADLLQRLITTVPDADYYIYSNVDIIVTPQIYRFIVNRTAAGVDSLTINRTSIRDRPYRPDDLPLIWAEAGEEDPGYDFFVFTKAMAERFDLGHIMIGIAGIGSALHLNLLQTALRHEKWHNQQLTKHVGDGSASYGRAMAPYLAHNRAELKAICRRFNLSEAYITANSPAANLSAEFVARHQARHRERQRRRRIERWRRRFRRMLQLIRGEQG